MGRVLLVVLLVVGMHCSPARAQFALSYPIEPPADAVRDALASRYGNALLEEFAKAVEQSSDNACLRDKGLDAEKIKEQGRLMFQRWGTRIMEMVIGNVDLRKYEAGVAARGGPDAPQELMRLRKMPPVERYVEMERPLRLAKALNFIIEQFNSYVLLGRIKLRSFSPLSTGNDRLLRMDPTNATEEAIDRYTANNKSPELDRFMKLSDMAGEALMEAFDRELALKWGPPAFYRGVEADLAEICVSRR